MFNNCTGFYGLSLNFSGKFTGIYWHGYCSITGINRLIPSLNETLMKGEF